LLISYCPNSFVFGQAKGYVKAPEKSTSPHSTIEGVFTTV
jgi:hypothetical protein